MIRPRSQQLLAILLAAIFSAGVMSFSSAESASAAGCPGSDKGPRKISSKTAAKLVVCLVNQKRAKHGKSKLNYSPDLAAAARSHSKQMQKSNCFDHVCPGEAALTGRYQRANYLPCSCSWGVAENIAWGPRSKGSPRKIVKAWMGSSSHRANILGSYEHVGAGVRWGSPNSRGSQAGTYTLDFGYKR